MPPRQWVPVAFRLHYLAEAWRPRRVFLSSATKLRLSSEAAAASVEQFEALSKLAEWSNGRDVDTFAQKLYQRQAQRMANLLEQRARQGGGAAPPGRIASEGAPLELLDVAVDDVRAVGKAMIDERVKREQAQASAATARQQQAAEGPVQQPVYAFQTQQQQSTPPPPAAVNVVQEQARVEEEPEVVEEEQQPAGDDGEGNGLLGAIENKLGQLSAQDFVRVLQACKAGNPPAELLGNLTGNALEAKKNEIKQEAERKLQERAAREAAQQKEDEEVQDKERLLKRMREMLEKTAGVERERLEKERKALEEAAQRAKKAQQVKKKLQKYGQCVMGFEWRDIGDRYQCAGGSHFVTKAELDGFDDV